MENNVKNILYKNGFSFKKAFGQNFILDTELLSNIVKKAGVTEKDVVLEIGCGAGTLTKELSKSAKKVFGYEIDTKLKPILEETLKDCSNTKIVFKDVMKENLKELEKQIGEKYILVANLPYYITTPIIMNFIENATNIKGMVVMVQKEVAERLTAKEGTSDYGAITVGISLRGDAEIVEYVDRTFFVPPPNVDSAVVKIVIKDNKFENFNRLAVRNVVRTAFSSRRKTLANNLIKGYKLTRLEVEEILTKVNLLLNVRGEELSSRNFIDLSNTLIEKGIL
ncbi:MAG: ribosomal RNA small subunit methyltransferase A [Clostridia bacterium]|nr:ribosomal RNA small subunit methyltransferase A [Clostridia bacterium]